MTETYPDTLQQMEDLPLRHFDGKIYVISSPDAIAKHMDEMLGAPILGFDTETKPSFRKGEKNGVSIVQLCNGENAWIIRLHDKETLRPLTKVFENEQIIKAGVAIRDDIKALQKVCSFKPAGFAELQLMAKELGINDISLKKLTASLLGFRISKRQQTSNWNQQQLSQAQILYAATDAWTSFLIYQRLTEIKEKTT